MKKLIFSTGVIFFLLALTTSSCKKDEVNLLIGTWNVSYFSQVTYLNGEHVNDSDTTSVLDPGDMVIKIFEDGTGEHWLNGVNDQNFTWVLNGDIITVTLDDEVNTEIEMTYTVTDTRLFLIGEMTGTYQGYPYVVTQVIIANRATG